MLILSETNMESNFYFEKPIDSIEDDKYGFDKHAITLAKTLLQMPLHESYTLTINGEWGSGKTSFVNLIIKHLEDSIELDNEKIIIIKFDTSLFQNSKEMISEYFKQLFSVLDKEKNINKSNEFKKLVKSFVAYGDKISLSFESFSSDNFLVTIWKKIKSIYNIWFNQAESQLTLQESKIKLSETLLKSKYRFIVIIDDMDRLPKEQVRHIFQLIYSLCKLPNHTFILPFDKKIVSNCINNAYGIENGETYIEKIIQREINVPEISSQKIKNNLLNTISDAGIEIDFSEKDYIELGYKICIQPLIRNIRDLNRLCDNFIFISNLTKDKINQFDLLILTSLKMKLPNLYRYISDNRYRVTFDDKTDALNLKEREGLGKLQEEFQKYEIFNSDILVAKRILDFLFPNFYLNYQGKREENQISTYPIHKHHICNSDYISSFFSSELEDDVCSFSQIQNLLLNLDAQQIITFFSEKGKKKQSLLKQTGSFISQETIEPSQLLNIAKAFSYIYDNDGDLFLSEKYEIFDSVMFKLDLYDSLTNLIDDKNLKMNLRCITKYLLNLHAYVYQSGESSLDENQYFNLRYSLFDAISNIGSVKVFNNFEPNLFFELYRMLRVDTKNDNMNETSKKECDKEINSIFNKFLNIKENVIGFVYIFRNNWNGFTKNTSIVDMRKSVFPEMTNLDEFAIPFVKEFVADYEYDNEISQTMELFLDLFN